MLTPRRSILVALCLACLPMAQAEVLEATDSGFHLQISRDVAAAPALAYAQFIRVGEWWNADHTWFGKAENLRIEAVAGGCFCERDGDRSALHMTVSYVDPGKAVHMTGGLGPLQAMGLHGAMLWKFQPLPAGGTRIVHEYRVTGYAAGGLQKLAGIVDQVQTQQLEGLQQKLQGPG